MDTKSKYRRIIKIVRRVAVLFVIAGVLVFVVDMVVWVVQLAIRNETHSCLYCGDKIPASPQACEQAVSDQVRVRWTWTTYLPPEMPLRMWLEHEQRLSIIITEAVWSGMITTPWVYYDITYDGGQTWARVWDYDNERGGYPRLPSCSYLGSLDDQFFWVWTLSALATTHDGGYTWTIRDLPDMGWWSALGTSTLVTFTSRLNGRFGQQYPQEGSESYVTTDGGITWARVDPDTD